MKLSFRCFPISLSFGFALIYDPIRTFMLPQILSNSPPPPPSNPGVLGNICKTTTMRPVSIRLCFNWHSSTDYFKLYYILLEKCYCGLQIRICFSIILVLVYRKSRQSFLNWINLFATSIITELLLSLVEYIYCRHFITLSSFYLSVDRQETCAPWVSAAAL